MANILMPSLADTIYQGEHGTASIEIFPLELDAKQDDEVLLVDLPIGVLTYSIRAYHAALGTNTRIVVYAGDDEIGSFTASSEGGTTRTWKPSYIDELRKQLRFKVRDGDGSGKLTIMLEYESFGY